METEKVAEECNDVGDVVFFILANKIHKSKIYRVEIDIDDKEYTIMYHMKIAKKGTIALASSDCYQTLEDMFKFYDKVLEIKDAE